MSRHQIAVYKAEREAGIEDIVRATASVAYIVPLEVARDDEVIRSGLHEAFASKHDESQYGLYYMKDLLVTTGWNKNRDVFDNTETWLARHTPEDRPFTMEHRPLDIIGHITASHAVDEKMVQLSDDLAVDELPAKFHLVNGSVLYTHSADVDRKALMEQTVAEIKNGEWFVSMECVFRGFDYGVIGPDGEQRIIPRNESTAFLTKHLTQYKGSGVYRVPNTNVEYSLGRVFRDITFSGKGLVKKPANPESVIFSSVASFSSVVADLGYLKSSEQPSNSREIILMAESNANEQSLRDLNSKLERQVETLQSEIAAFKSKDTEAVVTSLRKDVADRDATITGLKAQLDAVNQSVSDVQKRAEAAETALASSQDELKVVKAAELKRSRETLLRSKNAPETVVASLVEKLAVLDDKAFADTVATIAPSWKDTKAKGDPVVVALQQAKAEQDASLSTNNDEQAGSAQATITDFMGRSMRAARGGRSSAFTTSESNA